MAEEIFGGGGGGGGAAKVSLSGANTDGVLTLISTGTMYMAGGNNITISQNGNSLTFVGMNNVGATTFRGGVSTGGNTSGGTGTINNQIVFAGGNNVTLSQSINGQSATITISVPTQSAQTQNVVAISGSNSLYSSGTLTITGSNMVTVKTSGAGQALIIDATQSLQTSGLFQGTIAGNSTSGGAGYILLSSGTVTLAGGNNITLSQAGNAITISGPNIGGAQTGISGIAGSAASTVTAGTVQFGNANNVSFGLAGSTMTASFSTSQSVQTESRFNATLAGNSTSGGAGYALISSGVMTLAGGNNVTLSQAGNAVTISAGASGAGGIAASLSGNSTSGGAGYSLVSTGTLYFAGGNNITLSQDSNSITISGANAGGAQTGISGIAGSAASTVTAGTVQFANANNMSFGLAGSTMTASFSQSVQPAQTGVSGISGSNTVYTSGTVDFIGSNIVTIRSSAGQRLVIDASVAAQSVQTQSRFNATIAGNSTSGGAGYILISSGVLTLAGGNNITLSQAGNAITISGVEGGGAGISTYGNTAGTTGIAGDQIVFVGGSNVTLSQSIDGGASNATITINAAAGGAMSAGLSTNGNTSGDTGLVTGRFVLAGGANITLSGSTNAGSITVSISGGAGGGALSVGNSNIGNTVGETGVFSNRVVLAGGNNITLSGATNASGLTMTISGPTGGGAGMGTGSNTSGTQGSVGKELWFYGNSNIGLSQSVNGSSASLTIIGNAGAGGIAASLSGNSTSGGAGYSNVTSGTLILAGGNNITLSQDGSRVTISGANVGGAQTGISSIIASNQTYTSGAVSFVGSGIVTVRTGTGQNVIIDASGGGGGFTAGMGGSGNTAGTAGQVPAQLVIVGTNNISLSQSIDASSATITLNVIVPIISLGVSSGGNTSGNTGTVPNALVLAGGNNITLSQLTNASGATVTISGPSGGGAGMGTAASGTSGTNGTVGKELYFYGNSNIGLSQSVNGSSASLTIIGNAGGGGIAASIGGNSTSGGAGYSNVTSGTLILAGGNNITLSQDGRSVTISGPNVGGAQTGISGIAGSAASTVTAGTVQFANANNISFGLNSNTMTASFSQSVQPAQTGISGLAANGTTFTSGTVVFSNFNNITFGTSGAGAQQTITASASYAAQTVQTQNSVQVNGSSGAISFNAGANMSLSTVASALTFINLLSTSSYAANISNVSSAGTRSSVFAMVDHAHIGVGGIVVSNTATTWVGNVILSGTNITFVTGGNSSAGSIGISAAAPGGAAGTQTLGMSNLGNSGGTSGVATGSNVQFVFAGSNNITLSQSINGSSGTISIYGGAGGAFSGGVSSGGNTSGDTKTVGSQIVFIGGNNITLSQGTNGASASITISGPTGGGAGMGTGTNTSGTSGTVGKELYIYGNSNVGLSQSMDGASLSASLTVVAKNPTLVSKFYFEPSGAISSSAMTQSSASFRYVSIPYDISFSRIDIPIAVAITSSATTNTCAWVISSGLVIYSVSNNSTLNPITGSFGTTTHTHASNTANFANLTGGRMASFAIATSLSAGHYYIGFQLSSANTSSIGLSTTAAAAAISVLYGSQYTATPFQDFGVVSASSSDFMPMQGIRTTTISATNETIGMNQIVATGVSKARANFHVLFRNY